MKKPGIATRIFLIYGSALGILFLFSILALHFALQLREAPEQIVRENVYSLEAAIHLKRQIFHQKRIIYEMMIKGWSPVLMENLLQEKENFQSWLSKAKAVAYTKKEKKILQEISLLYEKVNSFHNEIAEKKSVPEALANQAIEDYGAMRGLCLQILEINEGLINNAVRQTKMDFQRMSVIILVFLLSGVTLSLLFFFFLTRSITKPIHRIMDEAHAADKLSMENHSQSKGDEIDRLDQHMHHIISLLENSDKTISEQRQRLLHAERLAAMGEISAKIAHEVRNPLTGIRTGIQLIKRQNQDDESFQRKLDRMIQELNRVERIVSDILNYSRPMRPNFRKIDLIKVLRDSIAGLKSDMSKKKIALETRNYGPVRIEADSDLLSQLFLNILQNASDNLGEGDRVMVRIEEGFSDASPYIHLVFEDTGPGIPPDQLDKIFKPFYSTKPLGTGLGLAICQNIVMEHKGRIWAENGSKGSRFHIVLPKKQEAV